MRIHAGDPAAEEDLFRNFEPRVRAFVVANSGDRDLAEELVQDVIWAVIRALRKGQVRQTDQIPAFLFSTARNLLHDNLRTRSREKLDRLAPDAEISNPAMEQREFERSHAARQAIHMLEPHERLVLLLSLLERGLVDLRRRSASAIFAASALDSSAPAASPCSTRIPA